MKHFASSTREFVGDHHAVTTPRHRFGAHDRNRAIGQEQTIDRCAKLFRGHVIGIPSEGFVLPELILRVGTCFPAAAQLSEMNILTRVQSDCFLQAGAGEVRITTGAGVAPHIHECPDLILQQELDELGQRAGGVTDRKYCGGLGRHGAFFGVMRPGVKALNQSGFV